MSGMDWKDLAWMVADGAAMLAVSVVAVLALLILLSFI